MNDKEKLMNELESGFVDMQKKLKFASSFDSIDKIFFIKDMVLKDGFVSERLSRRICHRIVETFMDWNGYLHSLVMPNPQNMLNLMESKLFNQDEKKEIMELMKKIMEISSRNSVIALSKDEKIEGKFIDDAVSIWDDSFEKRLYNIMVKVNFEWSKEK